MNINGIKIKMDIIDHDFGRYWPEDKKPRDIYTCRLKVNSKQYTFKFGQSLAKHGIEPSLSEVLQGFTWEDPRDFNSFCKENGYSTDSISALKIYKSVVREYKALVRLFGSDETLNNTADFIFNGE